MNMHDIKVALDELNDFSEKHYARQEKTLEKWSAENAALRERIELLETDREKPRGGPRGAKYSEFSTATGKVYVLPSETKMFDVSALRPEKQPEVSLYRWLAASVAGEKCGDREAVQYALELKQLGTGTSGILIPQQYISEWIDLLRAQSVLQRAGTQTLVMNEKTVNMSAVTADPVASWHTEAATINPNNPTFAARTLTAQTLVTRVQASLEVTQDSPDFGMQLAQVMTRAMAAELDRVGLEGSGTPPQPRGIKNTSGRSSQTSTGALTDYEELTSGIGALLEANCDLAQVSRFAIMSPGSWTAYANLVTGISSDKTPLARPRAIEAMEFLASTNIAGDQTSSPLVPTTIYLGDFRDLTLGIRREATIDQLRLTTYATNLLIEFVGYLRADYVARRPASFHTIEGVAA